MSQQSEYREEATLVAGCRDGNAFAQRLLYDRYAEQMMIVCLRYINDRNDAREVLMDGFCNCFKNMDRFTYQGQGSVRAWIKKIMVNQCLMFLRKASVLYKDMTDATEAEVQAGQSDAIDKLSAKEIMKLIHELPDGYRTIFNLYAFEQMTHKEIAAALNISENTSKSQLHKARALLQKKISHLYKTGL